MRWAYSLFPCAILFWSIPFNREISFLFWRPPLCFLFCLCMFWLEVHTHLLSCKLKLSYFYFIFYVWLLMNSCNLYQVPSSLNSSYCYILHSGSTVFTWTGNLTTPEAQELVERQLDIIKVWRFLSHFLHLCFSEEYLVTCDWVYIYICRFLRLG